MSTPIKYIEFRNKTQFPLMIDAWVDWSNSEHSVKVEPGQTLLLHSSVGEWQMHSRLFGADRQIWIDHKLDKFLTIGKFRSQSCMSGNYSWLEYNKPFQCVYSEESDSETGLIHRIMTFSYLD